MKNMSDQKFKRKRGIAEVKVSGFLLFFPFSFFFPTGFFGEAETLKSESIATRASESMVAVGVIYLPCVSSSSLGHLQLCCV